MMYLESHREARNSQGHRADDLPPPRPIDAALCIKSWTPTYQIPEHHLDSVHTTVLAQSWPAQPYIPIRFVRPKRWPTLAV